MHITKDRNQGANTWNIHGSLLDLGFNLNTLVKDAAYKAIDFHKVVILHTSNFYLMKKISTT